MSLAIWFLNGPTLVPLVMCASRSRCPSLAGRCSPQRQHRQQGEETSAAEAAVAVAGSPAPLRSVYISPSRSPLRPAGIAFGYAEGDGNGDGDDDEEVAYGGITTGPRCSSSSLPAAVHCGTISCTPFGGAVYAR